MLREGCKLVHGRVRAHLVLISQSKALLDLSCGRPRHMLAGVRVPCRVWSAILGRKLGSRAGRRVRIGPRRAFGARATAAGGGLCGRVFGTGRSYRTTIALGQAKLCGWRASTADPRTPRVAGASRGPDSGRRARRGRFFGVGIVARSGEFDTGGGATGRVVGLGTVAASGNATLVDHNPSPCRDGP